MHSLEGAGVQLLDAIKLQMPNHIKGTVSS
jgi:hypothetical protein